MASAENSSDRYLCRFDIGGTKCSVVIGDNTFSIKKKIVFETRTERGYKEILSDFKKNMRSLLKEFPGYNLKRIGISCGGPLDSKRALFIHLPIFQGGTMFRLHLFSVRSLEWRQPCKMMQMHAPLLNG